MQNKNAYDKKVKKNVVFLNWYEKWNGLKKPKYEEIIFKLMQECEIKRIVPCWHKNANMKAWSDEMKMSGQNYGTTIIFKLIAWSWINYLFKVWL